MRYFIRDKIFEILSTFVEAIDYINNEVYESANLVIEDVKSGLNSIRMTFDESFTAETSNQYDRIITQMEQQLIHISENKIKNQSTEKEVEKFKEQLNELEQKLKDEPEVKLEILFIPYKYSMWDSLESIWLAAKADPRCNARVMPIPYYDRDENGLLAEFHYEIEEYIKNDIPVVSYKDYDYTVIKPDVIYFHNPYDGNNRVTSVAPEFYSDKLKQHTDMLVYVPYLIETPYKNKKKSRTIYYTSGVKNSDKVILQSKALGELYESMGIEKEKIKVLGSPKLDSIVRRNFDKFDLPDNWQPLKYNRKVILYNSSISSLLNMENSLSFLLDALEIVTNSSDLSLIWRPHPLFESTIRSMRREYLEEYLAIKQKFNNNDNLLIDESDNTSLSFHISDALISDNSSLIPEYILTGKPIYIIDIQKEVTKDTIVSCDIFSCYFEEDFSVSDFIQMVRKEKDPKKIDRIQSFAKSVENTDGSSGEKIHQNIKSLIIK